MPSTFFEWVFFILEEYFPLFLRGTWTTLEVSITGTVIGFVIGLFVAVIRTVPLTKNDPLIKRILLKTVQWISVAYIELFRGTPMIVQAMVIFYGFPQIAHNLGNRFGIPSLTSFFLPVLGAAILIISVNTGAYMAEIIRGGIVSVDFGQTEGAHAIGMTHRQTMTSVILPQAVRNIMPSIGNEFVINIKDSSVLNVISVTELYFMAGTAAGTYFRYFESFFIAAVVYFVLTFTVTRLLRLVEKKMDGKDSYTIFGSQSHPDAEVHVKGAAIK